VQEEPNLGQGIDPATIERVKRGISQDLSAGKLSGMLACGGLFGCAALILSGLNFYIYSIYFACLMFFLSNIFLGKSVRDFSLIALNLMFVFLVSLTIGTLSLEMIEKHLKFMTYYYAFFCIFLMIMFMRIAKICKSFHFKICAATCLIIALFFAIIANDGAKLNLLQNNFVYVLFLFAVILNWAYMAINTKSYDDLFTNLH